MKRLFVFAAGTAAALLSTAALAQTAPAAPNPKVLRLCTGSTSGNYQKAGIEISKRIAPQFDEIKLINTGGSLDNLRRLAAGTCDMAFAQSDVADLYQLENAAARNIIYPFKTVYSEYAQILCPAKTGWTTLADLAKARKAGTAVEMIVGPDGSGTAETWRNWRLADPDSLGKIATIPDAVDTEAASKVKDSASTCMFWVSGINSADMQNANQISGRTRDKKPGLRLISITDKAIKDIRDARGGPAYTFEAISAKPAAKDKAAVYNNLIPDRSSWYQSADTSVDVATVNAVLYTTNAYRDLIKDKTGRLALQIDEASQTIWNQMNPDK